MVIGQITLGVQRTRDSRFVCMPEVPSPAWLTPVVVAVQVRSAKSDTAI